MVSFSSLPAWLNYLRLEIIAWSTCPLLWLSIYTPLLRINSLWLSTFPYPVPHSSKCFLGNEQKPWRNWPVLRLQAIFSEGHFRPQRRNLHIGHWCDLESTSGYFSKGCRRFSREWYKIQHDAFWVGFASCLCSPVGSSHSLKTFV